MPTQVVLVQTVLGSADLTQTEVQALELAEVLVAPAQVGALVLVVGAQADLAAALPADLVAVLPADLVAEVQVLAAGA